MLLTIDIVILLILLLYFYIGWNKGALYALTNIVGVLLAYISVALLAKPLTLALTNSFEVPRIQLFIICALTLFFSIVFVFAVLKRIMLRNIHYSEENKDDYHHSFLSKLLGGSITALLGMVVLSVIVFSYEAISGLSQKKNLDISSTVAAQVTSVFSRKLVTNISKNEQASKIANIFAAKPRLASKCFKSILENINFRKVIISEEVLSAAVTGDRFVLETNRQVDSLARDIDLRKRLVALKIIDNSVSPDDLKRIAVDKLITIGSRVSKSKKVSKLRLQASELRESGALKKANLPRLYKNKQFQGMLDILFFQ